jgi:hypothetical protein
VIGTFPTEMALLTNLRDFELEGFNVVGTLEGKFASPKLETLTLNRTGLSGTLPNELFLNNANLRSLYVGYSRIEGALPTSLWSMTALENVTLLANAFSGPLETHMNLNGSTYLTTAIRTYSVPGTAISVALCSSCSPHFTFCLVGRLQISYNQLSGSLPESLGALSSLESLSLRRNQIVGSVGASLGSLIKLSTFGQTND